MSSSVFYFLYHHLERRGISEYRSVTSNDTYGIVTYDEKAHNVWLERCTPRAGRRRPPVDRDRRVPGPAPFVTLRRHGAHPPAGVGAAAAGVRAGFHLRIVTEPIAVLCAAIAHLRTDRADAVMQWRAAEHKVGAGVADCGAVEQQPDVRRFRVLPAVLETVGDRFEADVVAFLAELDALLHLCAQLVTCGLCHDRSSSRRVHVAAQI